MFVLYKDAVGLPGPPAIILPPLQSTQGRLSVEKFDFVVSRAGYIHFRRSLCRLKALDELFQSRQVASYEETTFKTYEQVEFAKP